MRAAVVRSFASPLQIEEVLVPAPDPGEVLIKITVTGVCHTDLHAGDGDWPFKPSPSFIAGREVAGTTAAVGSEVSGINRVFADLKAGRSMDV